MQHDTMRAKQLLFSTSSTLVLVRGTRQYASDQKGIAGLLGLVENGTALEGFCAADRVVGKAAALLFVYAGVREVFAEVISEKALEVFQAHGLPCVYAATVPYIQNRTHSGPCPMEQSVEALVDPAEALYVLRRTLNSLRAQSRTGR